MSGPQADENPKPTQLPMEGEKVAQDRAQAEQSASEYLPTIPNARITATEVIIGGTALPGLILGGSVVVRPGLATGMNLVDVTFLVGRVDIEDPTEDTDDTDSHEADDE